MKRLCLNSLVLLQGIFPIYAHGGEHESSGSSLSFSMEELLGMSMVISLLLGLVVIRIANLNPKMFAAMMTAGIIALLIDYFVLKYVVYG